MSLRHALLGLLADQPASGYDLLQRFARSLDNVWSASQTQVYTELTKLAGEGLITASEEGPRRRKEYALTPAGDAELRNWLGTTESKTPTRNEMLLRIFFLGILPQQQALDHMATVQERSRAGGQALAALEQTTEWDDDDFSEYGHIALEWGKRYCAMTEEWAQWAQEQIIARRPRESGRETTG
ncbi:PadR family transcriptional regulator [Nocardia sp. NEAU-G5]|uniref:PadR family transcriptional regulator n=1 Tax=Nocardia albiluteola TaxID=2842303 RepID=A0ABS6B7B8_9NOCA|nr:PadR family transcriptional regulator [Nocardia albiluteola]MBU3062525.1 PadR family transcriptional regulator [Nocardia albiluteola]MBU3065641.1 PadR family transcriptional regulator [Nocardia albiluteola]